MTRKTKLEEPHLQRVSSGNWADIFLDYRYPHLDFNDSTALRLIVVGQSNGRHFEVNLREEDFEKMGYKLVKIGQENDN